jgi:hypothetical protein
LAPEIAPTISHRRSADVVDLCSVPDRMPSRAKMPPAFAALIAGEEAVVELRLPEYVLTPPPLNPAVLSVNAVVEPRALVCDRAAEFFLPD